MLGIAVMVVVAFFALSVQADEPTAPRHQAGLEEFGARLALTPEQEAQVWSIFQDHIESQMAVLDKYDVEAGDRGDADTVDIQQMRAFRAELGASREKIEERLSGVLSETQMAEFRRISAEQEAELRERLLSRRLDEIGAKLELTPEQEDRMRPVQKEHFEAQINVLDKHGLGPGNRADGKRPGFRTLRRLRKDMDEINENTGERLSAILTGMQMAVYEALQTKQRKKLRELLWQR